MLVLSRRPNERIMLDIPACDHPQKVEITLVRCSVFGSRIGIDAPLGIGIVRAESSGIPYSAFKKRINRGWSVELSVETPLRSRK